MAKLDCLLAKPNTREQILAVRRTLCARKSLMRCMCRPRFSRVTRALNYLAAELYCITITMPTQFCRIGTIICVIHTVVLLVFLNQVRTWFLKIDIVRTSVCVCLCVSLCVHPQAIKNYSCEMKSE